MALLLIAGAVLWALRSNRPHNPAPDELYSTDHHNVADGLTTLPKDYADIPREVPQLRPPSPGDLRHPAVTAEGQSGSIGLDPEQQHANQETEAARTSKVFASTTTSVTASHTSSQETATKAASSSDETFTQNGQDSKLLFVNAPVDRRTTAPDGLSRPASPFVVQAGTIYLPRIRRRRAKCRFPTLVLRKGECKPCCFKSKWTCDFRTTFRPAAPTN
jgi:type IV secretion system protein TrbI